MKLYYQILQGNKIHQLFTEEEYNNFIKNYGYLNLVFKEIEKEGPELDFILKNSGYLKFENNKFILDEESYNKTNIKSNNQTKIKILKSQLSDSDYKIIKCYEAFMRKLPLQYNLEELCIQRDLLRSQINQLEEELNNL